MKRRAFIKLSAAILTTSALGTPARADGHARVANFIGKSGHKTTGSVKIIKNATGNSVELQDNFTFDGAPDAKVTLGADGVDTSATLAPLRSNSGAQSYAVPESINLNNYNEVWIWCEQYNVPLGVARF